MDPQFWLNVLFRWLHVSSAVVGVGAAVVLRLVLLPAVEAAGAGAGGDLAARMLPGFKRLLHIALGLLLVTGLYNLWIVIPRANGLGELKSTYHMLLGIKMLLGLGVIAWAMLLLAGSVHLPRLQGQRSQWLAITVAAALILLVSATLRRTWDLHPRLTAPAADASDAGAPPS